MSLIRESAHLMGDNPQLMGIFSLPSAEVKLRSTAVLILSSGLLHRAGPFRLHVDLARRLANYGFATLRLDQAGRGDSNRSEGLTPGESARQEILTARDFVKTKTGINKLICVGLCSGADDALESIESCEDIMGIIQLDGFAARNWRYYLTYYVPRLLNPIRLAGIISRRINRLKRRFFGGSNEEEFETLELSGIRNFPDLAIVRKSFNKLFERSGSALCVFTGSIEDYYYYHGQLRQNLNLKKNEERLTEVFWPESNHTYSIVAHRNNLVELAVDWCDKTFQ